MTFSYPDAPPPVPPTRRRDDPDHAPWGVFEVLVGIFVVAAPFAVLALIALQAGGGSGDAADASEGTLAFSIIFQIVYDILAVGVAAFVSLRRYRVGPRAWGLRRERPIAFWLSVGVLVAAFVGLTAYQLIVDALGLERLRPESNVPVELFEYRSVFPLTVLLIVVVAPVCEEMFFRGFIFRGLQRRLGRYGAALASGALFSIIHVNSVELVGLIIPFTFIGFIFAVLVARTGSLWNAIAVHAAFNAVGVLAFVLNELINAR